MRISGCTIVQVTPARRPSRTHEAFCGARAESALQRLRERMPCTNPFSVGTMNGDSEKRAERLLDQLHQWAMEALEMPRDQRDAFIVEVATQYHDDAVRNGLSASQAEEW